MTTPTLFGDTPSMPVPTPCVVCGSPTMREADSRHIHSACEPRHTGATDPPTSWEAGANTATGSRSHLMKSIVAAIKAAPTGLTDDDLVMLYEDQHPGSVAKRRSDATKLGLVADSGRTRPTRRGRPAVVWVAPLSAER